MTLKIGELTTMERETLRIRLTPYMDRYEGGVPRQLIERLIDGIEVDRFSLGSGCDDPELEEMRRRYPGGTRRAPPPPPEEIAAAQAADLEWALEPSIEIIEASEAPQPRQQALASRMRPHGTTEVNEAGDPNPVGTIRSLGPNPPTRATFDAARRHFTETVRASWDPTTRRWVSKPLDDATWARWSESYEALQLIWPDALKRDAWRTAYRAYRDYREKRGPAPDWDVLALLYFGWERRRRYRLTQRYRMHRKEKGLTQLQKDQAKEAQARYRASEAGKAAKARELSRRKEQRAVSRALRAVGGDPTPLGVRPATEAFSEEGTREAAPDGGDVYSDPRDPDLGIEF